MDEVPFGRYRLIEVIGEGGMGKVYKAHDTMMGRDVAIKVLAPELAAEPGYEERFRREAYTAARLTEPHIIPIHEAGEIDGRLYLVMPIIDGIDLQSLLKRNGPMAPELAVRVVEQLAAALDAAHKHGLVHRDVKPSNALMVGNQFVYLIDFGIAHDTAATHLTSTGSVLGTFAYMAPERFEGKADARADVYALACVLHECLTGSQPFPGNSIPQQMHAHLYQGPPRPAAQLPSIPTAFDAVIARGMAKNPADRYPTAGALAHAAHNALTASQQFHAADAARRNQPPNIPAPATPGPPPAHLPARDTSSPLPVATPPRRRRTGLILALVAVIVVAAGGTGAWFLLRNHGSTPRPVGTVEGKPIAVGKEPYDIQQGEGFLWTANTGESTISKIDPATGAAEQIEVGGAPQYLAVTPGAVWVLNWIDAVTRVDIATGKASAPIPGGAAEIGGIAAGGGYVWLSHKDNTVTRIDTNTRALTGNPIHVGKAPMSMAFGHDALYVVNQGDRTITTIDSTGTVRGDPLKLDDELGGIEVVKGTIYVGSTDDVTPIDEVSFAMGKPIPLKGGSYFRPDGQGIWVVFPVTNELRWFDNTGAETRGGPVTGVGKGITGMVLLDDALWLADQPANSVVRVKVR